MARNYIKIVMHKSGRADPTQTIVECENDTCSNTFYMDKAHSIVTVSYAIRGGELKAFQCPEEQHFCCSQECMVEMATKCIKEHLLPLHQADIVSQ